MEEKRTKAHRGEQQGGLTKLKAAVFRRLTDEPTTVKEAERRYRGTTLGTQKGPTQCRGSEAQGLPEVHPALGPHGAAW